VVEQRYKKNLMLNLQRDAVGVFRSATPLAQQAVMQREQDEEMDDVVRREMSRISREEGEADPDELTAEQAAIDKEQVDEMKKELATPQEGTDG
jgi:hypothetical protein